jgi:hypothetical protein
MRMPRYYIVLPIAVLAAFLSGCATYSLHPFYKPDENTLEPGLVGAWMAVDKTKITIEANKDETYEAEVMDSDSNSCYRYTVRLIRVGNNLFADSILEEESLSGKDFNLPYGVAPLHFLYKVSLNGDTLRMSLLNHDWLVKQFQAKRISVAHEYMDESADPQDSNILLTASSADLQKFIQQIGDNPDAFEEPDTMQRQK